jgi:hypothetical protein
LVSDILAGNGKIVNLFLQCNALNGDEGKIWPFLLQIKSMMELGEFLMLPIMEMKKNLVTLSLSASDYKQDGAGWIHDALLGNEEQGDPSLCTSHHSTWSDNLVTQSLSASD